MFKVLVWYYDYNSKLFYLLLQQKKRYRCRRVLVISRIVRNVCNVFLRNEVQQDRRHEREQTGEAAHEHDHRHSTQLRALLDQHWLNGDADHASGQREHLHCSDLWRQRSIVDFLGVVCRLDGAGAAGQTNFARQVC